MINKSENTQDADKIQIDFNPEMNWFDKFEKVDRGETGVVWCLMMIWITWFQFSLVDLLMIRLFIENNNIIMQPIAAKWEHVVQNFEGR